MGIFTRFRDIISSNINSMLDKAEDPEKLIKLMIREMEDTLVEMKASCAGLMAGAKKSRRMMEEVETKTQFWNEKASLAVSKGREDLAREALLEKRRYGEKARALEKEISEMNGLVEQYQGDIRQLEEKLASAREKQRILVQRHLHAGKKRHAQEQIRRADSTEVIAKFDELETRIERMEAEAELVNLPRRPALEVELERLQMDDEIEKELQSIKATLSK
ncbi:MAG: phage shock protein PspA [Desulfobacteraceae bacterium]|nr:MAG: phage shock protein PspA [Desulfobacteraceae bacterium]